MEEAYPNKTWYKSFLIILNSFEREFVLIISLVLFISQKTISTSFCPQCISFIMNGLMGTLDNLTIHNNPNTKWVRFRGTPCIFSSLSHLSKIKAEKGSPTQEFKREVKIWEIYWLQLWCLPFVKRPNYFPFLSSEGIPLTHPIQSLFRFNLKLIMEGLMSSGRELC